MTGPEIAAAIVVLLVVLTILISHDRRIRRIEEYLRKADILKMCGPGGGRFDEQ